MARPTVVDIDLAPSGAAGATVVRADGSQIRCRLVVGKDNTLCVEPPKGEWLHEPPRPQMKGQQALDDAGDAPGWDWGNGGRTKL